MENDGKMNKINIPQKIPRYPLNGHSNYLFDKFYIFGYNELTLKKYLYNDENIKNFISFDKKQEENKFIKFQIDEFPILLNEFTSNYEKECLEIDMIRDMILPKKINFYYIEEEKSSKSPDKRRKRENNNNSKHSSFYTNDNNEKYYLFDESKKEVPPSYNVIFSSNPQSGNNSKKSINGFAYIFYKKLREEKSLNRSINMNFYIPIIFSIISEYPFYNSFYQLCKQFKLLFSNNKLRIPLEIIIYNIINFSPSPLNADVFLSLKPIIDFELEGTKNSKTFAADTIEEIKEEDNGGDENNDKNNTENNQNFIKESKLSTKSIDLYKNTSSKRKSQLTYRINRFVNINVLKHIRTMDNFENSKDFNNLKNDLEEKIKKIKFESLTGYPLIQYNLAKVLLQTLTPIDVIDIFLYTFLEKDVIFFSKDLEFLSLTINSYLNLNFPLNDEKYYFINACVSYENYINGNSTFVGSTFTTIIGINDSYNPKYQSGINKLKEHIAIDLDNGKVYKVEDKSDKEKSKQNKELFNFIKNICKNREVKNDTNILYREINLLNLYLTDIYNRKNDKEDELYYNIFKNKKYIDYSEENIKNINLKIQDSFYRFINNLCLYVYQNLSVKTEADDMNKINNSDDTGNKDVTEMNVLFLDEYKEDNAYSKEELYFLEELRETMKFQSFVYSFVQSYNPIDLYKIPLTFTEEFISIISRKSAILEGDINFLSLIDKLYKINSKGEINIDLESFLKDYFSNYKDYFDREIQDISEKYNLYPEKIKIKNANINNKVILEYKSYELDERILLLYLNMINMIENDDQNESQDKNADINKNLYLKLKSKVEENIPKNISVTDIETVIENYAIEKGILSESDLCSANLIILFTLCFRSLKTYIDCQSFLGSLFQDFTIFRKYYSMIMSMTYMTFEESLAKKDYKRAEECFYLYYLCINSLRNVKLIPNESLMNIIKKFNKINFDSIKQRDSYKPEGITEENNQKLFEANFPIDEITNKNLYVTHNFSAIRVYKEKEIVESVNDSQNSNKYFVSIDGTELMQPKIKFNNGKYTFNSFFYSQKLLLLTLVEEYQNFIVDVNWDKLRPKIILDACLNIFIFMRNSEDFINKSDIFAMMKYIFYMFLHHFFVIKMEKESK